MISVGQPVRKLGDETNGSRHVFGLDLAPPRPRSATVAVLTKPGQMADTLTPALRRSSRARRCTRRPHVCWPVGALPPRPTLPSTEAIDDRFGTFRAEQRVRWWRNASSSRLTSRSTSRPRCRWIKRSRTPALLTTMLKRLCSRGGLRRCRPAWGAGSAREDHGLAELGALLRRGLDASVSRPEHQLTASLSELDGAGAAVRLAPVTTQHNPQDDSSVPPAWRVILKSSCTRT